MNEKPREQAQTGSITYEGWLAVLALASVAIGIHDLLRPRATPGFRWHDWVDLAIVSIFIADFVVQARRRGSYRAYARENWWELPSLLPVTGGMIVHLEAFPIVRAFRLVRFIRFLRILRLGGVLARFRANGRILLRVIARAQLLKLLSIGAVVVLAGSVAGFVAERGANERMASYGDALWWALNMFSNVAYVDFQPATAAGRVVAGVLEILGIAFIGVFAASVTNALIREDPAGRAGQ